MRYRKRTGDTGEVEVSKALKDLARKGQVGKQTLGRSGRRGGATGRKQNRQASERKVFSGPEGDRSPTKKGP